MAENADTPGTELVRLDVAAGIATITLDSPRNRNALSAQLRRELIAHLDSAIADDAVRVTVGGDKPAFERSVPKLARFEDAEKFSVDLQPGWTPVVVRLSTIGQTHRLGLQFTGEELRTSGKQEK